MKKIFDSHAHYDDKKFNPDRDKLLAELYDRGVVGIINCAANVKSAEKSLDLASKYEYIWAAVGCHPHSSSSLTEGDYDRIRQLAKEKKAVAIGEIGLDYHYDFSPREVQRESFERQLSLATELDLPVIVHDREAHRDTMEALKKYRPRGVIHCFSGSVEMAREAIDLGLYIGLGGAVTFKGAKKPVEVASFAPLDRLLLETDAPYMAPVPFRGRRCDSEMILYSAQKIADIKNKSLDEILKAGEENAKLLFDL